MIGLMYILFVCRDRSLVLVFNMNLFFRFSSQTKISSIFDNSISGMIWIIFYKMIFSKNKIKIFF